MPSLRRIAVGAAIAIAVLILIPYVIAPFYRVVDPVSTLMLWRRATGARVERVWLPIDRIAPALPLAVIGAEDGTFCRNHGIDLGAMREALEQFDDSGVERGASTLTQQAAKNLFLWQGRSIIRKTSPSGARTASSAPRPAPATPSANPPAISTPARRRNSPPSCPIRSGAAPASQAPWCGGSPGFMSAGPRPFRGSMPASAPPSA